MRLRPIVEITDRHQLKPNVGDVVRYEGVEHVVTEVGSRYIHMYRRDDANRARKFAKVTEVIKTGVNIRGTGDAPKTPPSR